MDMISLEDMHLFVGVADLQSFTALGEREGMPKSTVSRRLRCLEDQLGVRLLERTTRSIRLTEVGGLFYHRCIQLLQDVETTQQQVSQFSGSPVGLLRVYAPNEFSRSHFPSIIPQFTQRYPGIQLNMISGTFGQHMLEDRIDVMIHIDEPEDSSFIARPIAKVTTNYYVSQAYIDRCGEPETPKDLLNHICIVETRNQTKDVNIWAFNDSDQKLELHIDAQH